MYELFTCPQLSAYRDTNKVKKLSVIRTQTKIHLIIYTCAVFLVAECPSVTKTDHDNKLVLMNLEKTLVEIWKFEPSFTRQCRCFTSSTSGGSAEHSAPYSETKKNHNRNRLKKNHNRNRLTVRPANTPNLPILRPPPFSPHFPIFRGDLCLLWNSSDLCVCFPSCCLHFQLN